ncbi:MAG: T9SS type A sorting domain-containing protein [Flavobacteriales bacterium]
MIKASLIITLILSSIMVKAQLPNGSFGPNFTVSDINGNTHTLYDILDSGYTVVMDLNATWCQPCWNYHQGGELETLWEEHGPAGWPGVSENTTDDVFVFMIESDNSTGMSHLDGTAVSYTYGDWITGTSFPIVDDYSVSQAYELSYYPTVFTVCPNRRITESGALSASNHYNTVGQCIDAQEGKNIAIYDYLGETTTCDTEVHVKANFQNMGTQAISDFTAEIFEGTTLLGSQQYNGNPIEQYSVVELDFGTINVSGFNANIQLKTLTADDMLESDNSLSQTIEKASIGTETMNLKITTDNFGSQVSWKIKNDQDSVVASGGPYSNSSNTTTYEPIVQDDEDISFSTSGCYYFEVYDSQNNGMYNSPAHDDGPTFFRLISNGINVVEIFGDDYTNTTKQKFIYNSSASMDEKWKVVKTSVYPNPTSGMSHLKLVSKEEMKGVELCIFNLLGEEMSKQTINFNTGENTIPLNLNGYKDGIYNIKLESSKLNISHKLLLLNQQSSFFTKK